eukprot:TRINITY_DN80_c1_g1_i1.p1 TRINITY_DN80_c1_g1~~TRINITY_DN80_c1_g1_i1.p1  ORF type:complete len:475 (+),score=167.53 TRINITY_DN80_c1_g1_i1:127-1551(+)
MGNSVAQWSGHSNSPNTAALFPFTPYDPVHDPPSSPRAAVQVDPAIRPTMNSVLDELKRRFERDDFPGKTIEESWIVISSEPPGEPAARELLRRSGGPTSPTSTTLAWVSNGAVSYVSYFKPADADADAISDTASDGAGTTRTDAVSQPSAEEPTATPAANASAGETRSDDAAAPELSMSTDVVVIPPQLEDQLRELKEKVEQLQHLKRQMEELSQSIMGSPRLGQAAPAAPAASGPPAFAFFHDYTAVSPSSSLSAQSSTDDMVVVDDVPPPPPPPPPPGSGPKVAIGSIPLRRQEKKARTRDELEQAVRTLVQQSDVTDSNKPRAVANFLQAFPDPKANAALETLVTSYPFLVRSMPLQPKSCFSRMKVWEDNLFKKVDGKQAEDIRKKKTIEIEKLDSEEKILDEIKRIFDYIELMKRKEAEKQAELARRSAAGNMLQELKAKQRALEQRSLSQLTDQELQSMEQGEIEFE